MLDPVLFYKDFKSNHSWRLILEEWMGRRAKRWTKHSNFRDSSAKSSRNVDISLLSML
jgi:hypothetical protein